MATPNQIETIAKNIVSTHLLIYGDFDLPKDVLSGNDIVEIKKEIDNIAYSLVENGYKLSDSAVTCEDIVKDILLNVK